ncbi:hypothetical protein P7H12_23010 [Paenibacillus larvae]|nr:hypothetical protein [Paenibacillus larvae]MDT2265877.1 hypothetical protein [Paenibacillus larvae]
MAFHFVAIMSNYVKGMRIGWHYLLQRGNLIALIKQFMSRVEEKYSDAQLGIHKIATDSVTWRSVVEKDSFFEDVFVTTDIENLLGL